MAVQGARRNPEREFLPNAAEVVGNQASKDWGLGNGIGPGTVENREQGFARIQRRKKSSGFSPFPFSHPGGKGFFAKR